MSRVIRKDLYQMLKKREKILSGFRIYVLNQQFLEEIAAVQNEFHSHPKSSRYLHKIAS